jgi:hypothetical protein
MTATVSTGISDDNLHILWRGLSASFGHLQDCSGKKRLRPKEEGEAKRINTPMVSKQ